MLVAASHPSSAEPNGTGFADWGFNSSYRHYGLVNTVERSGWAWITDIGGRVGAILPYDGSVTWQYEEWRLEYTERDLENSQFMLTDKSRAGWIGVDLPVVPDRLLVDARSGVARENDETDVVYAARVKAMPSEAIEIEITSSRTVQSISLDGVFWDEKISLAIPLERKTGGLRTRVYLFGRLSLFLGYNDFAVTAPKSIVDGGYAAGIDGAAEYRTQGIRLGRPEAAHIQLTWDRIHASGQVNLYSDGIRFGQIAKLKGQADRWQLSGRPPFASRTLSLAVDYLSGSVELAGHVESWPFSDPLEDLLGARRNFKGTSRFSLWRFMGKTAFSPFLKVDMAMTLDLYRAFPDFQFADWRPSFLVFGVADMDRYHLQYERLDFGCLRMDASRAFGRFVIACDITQLFPIAVKKVGEETTGTGQPDGGGEDSSSRHLLWKDSGRSIHVQFGYSL